MIGHIHTMLAPWCCYLLKRERAFVWCMTCLQIARVRTFLVVMGVTWRIFRLSMYRDSWALTCLMTCARRAVTVRDRWWYDNLRDRVVARDAYAIFPGCVFCDYFRSLSGFLYQCRAYHLRWLRLHWLRRDFDAHTLSHMTQVWSLRRIITSRHRHAIIIVIVTLHMFDHVTCMITSELRVVISSIINWISWFWPPWHCHRAC